VLILHQNSGVTLFKMSKIFNKIKELEGDERLSKHEQLVQGIINSIDDGLLTHGNQLPSVNQMVKQLGFARKTIVKAYSELIERGILESRDRIGYFLTNESTGQTVKVVLLLYAYHTFQEIFYNTFRSALGDNIQLDLYFHHNNPDVYKNTLANIKNRYGMYVIAPIQGAVSKKILKSFSPKKLLIVDRFVNLGSDYSYVAQEFENSMYEALTSLVDEIKNYKEFIVIYRKESDYPKEILKAVKKFSIEYKIKAKVIREYIPGSIKKGTVYMTIGDTELWTILKDTEKANYKIGTDVGIISHNDSPIKEIICGGITTFSTDFQMMAEKAADFVLNKNKTQEIIPNKLVRRKSL